MRTPVSRRASSAASGSTARGKLTATICAGSLIQRLGRERSTNAKSPADCSA
jgi:hypothetical protein